MTPTALRRAPEWSLAPRPGMCRAHLVGVAGAGMRALADVLLESGWHVSGSDAAATRLETLVERGLVLRDDLPVDAHLVVSSDAVPAEDPRRQQARALSIPSLSYPQFLGALSATRPTLAIAGTHGKSTTTAMAAAILQRAGAAPAVLGGGTPLGMPSGGRAGQGELLVVEACEFRRNFLHLRPQAAVLLGIEFDHVDCYASAAEVAAAFAAFADRVPTGGLLLANAGCSRTMAAVSAVPRLVTFGLEPWADWWAADLRHERGRYAFRLFHRGRHASTIRLALLGRHHVTNALAAAALAAEHGASMRAVREALEEFAGLERRLEILPPWHGVSRVDDYAHHPTAVAATLAAVREMYPGQKIACVFEPHQLSRTVRLLDDFARSLHNADTVWIAPVYCAREQVAPAAARAAATALAHQIWARGGDALVCESMAEIACRLRTRLAPGQVLVTAGAGDIRNLHDELG